MAEILDDNQENEALQDDEQLVDFNEPEEQATEEVVEEPTLEEEQEEDIPEKYRGKSTKDIIRMHSEAEKLLGKQSSEVGELRKFVDNFIRNQSVQPTVSPQPTEEKEDEIDFFDDPQKAVEAAIAKHPKIKEAENIAAAMKQQQTLAMIQQTHPDFADVIQDPEFKSWVESSRVRSELYNRADKAYDFDSADELLSTWKKLQGAVQMTKEVEEKELSRSRKAAATGSGSGSGEARSRKVYRRSDIMNLMQNDPARYLELADEITLAYAEGRVKK